MNNLQKMDPATSSCSLQVSSDLISKSICKSYRSQCLVGSQPLEINRRSLGFYAPPLVPVGPIHTLAMWLYRHGVQQRPSQAKLLYKVGYIPLLPWSGIV